MNIGFGAKILISVIRLFSLTWRFKIFCDIPSKPAIIVFWHGFMLPVWKLFSKHLPYGVVSKSKDGEILSTLLEKWNFRLIRGSSATGGKEIIEEMEKVASDNYLLITPDGARGPIYKMKPGAFIVSQRTGVPIYLTSVKVHSEYIFKKSWDKFSLPLPFSKIDISFSEPIQVSDDKTREGILELMQQTEEKMNKIYGLS